MAQVYGPAHARVYVCAVHGSTAEVFAIKMDSSVILHLYDLSPHTKRLLDSVSAATGIYGLNNFVKKKLLRNIILTAGLFHTGIVVYGTEYSYGRTEGNNRVILFAFSNTLCMQKQRLV